MLQVFVLPAVTGKVLGIVDLLKCSREKRHLFLLLKMQQMLCFALNIQVTS